MRVFCSLCVAFSVLSGSSAFAAVEGYAKIENSKGPIRGGAQGERFDVRGYKYGAIGRVDLETRQREGKRVHATVCFLTTSHTTDLKAAAAQNELLKVVEFDFVRPAKNGEESTFKVYLLDATIATLRTTTIKEGTVSIPADEVCLTYRKIKEENPVTKLVTEDDWH